MKGSEIRMLEFMEGMNNRFIIPVYQRKYNWNYDNCRQLYEDLKKIIKNNNDSHFFGSIVSKVFPNGGKIEYHIIDGQQRLTTISLLLLAITNLIEQGMVKVSEENFYKQIRHFLVHPYAKEDNIKLISVKDDREAFERLFGDSEDYINESNLTLMYKFFCDMILKEEISIHDLYSSIGKLEIISITLDERDNAQLIFESLNSTGLALTEGDKIRNFVLMDIKPEEQSQYYGSYWAKIEKCTKNDVSNFIRDYLSIKEQITPRINMVYTAFKNYAGKVPYSIKDLLEDLLRYARLFEKLLTCNSGLNKKELDDCLYRLMRLDVVVIRPFLMEVLYLNQEGKLTVDDVLEILLVIESYLLRRNICDVPTNALNKIFLNLNKEIIRYDGTDDNYVKKFIYTLIHKKDSGRFPNDEEFNRALSTKQIYQMKGKYKQYLFERFENYGTVETKDIYIHLDNRIYTIEHIMPQSLTPEWRDELGSNVNEIHDEWLHRLANLTLTGYNPSLSNKSFKEKRDSENGGYKVSGLRMNQNIATKESWGLYELKERNEEMCKTALKIWSYPETNFKPVSKEFDCYTLDDESIDFTGRSIIKYSYQNMEHTVSSWVDMFENIVKFLHNKNKSVLEGLVYNSSNGRDIDVYVSSNSKNLTRALEIDKNIYIEKNTNTMTKIFILRRLFNLYAINPIDLIFYLKDV